MYDLVGIFLSVSTDSFFLNFPIPSLISRHNKDCLRSLNIIHYYAEFVILKKPDLFQLFSDKSKPGVENYWSGAFSRRCYWQTQSWSLLSCIPPDLLLLLLYVATVMIANWQKNHCRKLVAFITKSSGVGVSGVVYGSLSPHISSLSFILFYFILYRNWRLLRCNRHELPESVWSSAVMLAEFSFFFKAVCMTSRFPRRSSNKVLVFFPLNG